MGLKAIPMRADTGPIGGDLSHEFIILAETGESQVFCHKDYLDFDVPPADTNFDDVEGIKAVGGEVDLALCRDRREARRGGLAAIPEGARVSARGIEVGHIFYFGTKYSEPMGAGAGPGRRAGAGAHGLLRHRRVAPGRGIIEASHDEAGIIWPEAVAPFKVA
jgi:prolyl-tRNA synthetase